MATTCKTCDASWTGHRIEHCATSGDMHRVGDHALTEGSERRRCLTAEEMGGKGMRMNARDQWTTGQSGEAWWKP